MFPENSPNLKIGDKVLVYKGLPPAKVVRIFAVNKDGKETKWDFETARVKAELDWGEFGKSKINLDDYRKVWVPYLSQN